MRAVVLFLGVAAAGVAAVITMRPKPSPIVRAVERAGEPASVGPAPTSQLATTTAAQPDKAPEPAAPEPVRAAVEPPAPKPRGRAPAKPAAVPKSSEGERAAPAPVEAAPRDPCKPPYTVDSAGVKHFKVDCVIDGRR
jgi:hypothetical protein